MKNSKWIFILASVIMLGMLSCKKGDAGPSGPIGPAGPDSVVYSPWITLATTYNTTDSLFKQTLAAPSLTQAILDSGVILTYVNFKATNGTYHISPISSLNYFISEDYSVGTVNLLSTQDLTGLAYRYVTIPGSKLAGNKSSGAIQGYTIQELKALPFEDLQKIAASGTN